MLVCVVFSLMQLLTVISTVPVSKMQQLQQHLLSEEPIIVAAYKFIHTKKPSNKATEASLVGA